MAKIHNTKYKILPKLKCLALKQIIILHKRKAVKNKNYQAKYIKLQTEHKEI